jgi:hypothetical protein
MKVIPTANSYTGVRPLFNASISATTMTVNSVAAGTIFVGMVVNGAASGTFVTAFAGGSGGNGNYTVSISQTLSGRDMNGSTQNGTLLTGPKFLVGVYDPITHLKGFIDPTSSLFAKYDQLLDNAFDLGPTANTAAYGSPVPPLGGQAARLTVSESVFNATGTAQAPLTASSGQINVNNTTTTIHTTACTVNSKIFLTGNGNDLYIYQFNAPANGSFSIRTHNNVNVNWLIVN